MDRTRAQWEARVQGTMRRPHLEGRGFAGETLLKGLKCQASNRELFLWIPGVKGRVWAGGSRQTQVWWWHWAGFPGKAGPMRLLLQLISVPGGSPALY